MKSVIQQLINERTKEVLDTFKSIRAHPQPILKHYIIKTTQTLTLPPKKLPLDLLPRPIPMTGRARLFDDNDVIAKKINDWKLSGNGDDIISKAHLTLNIN